MISATSATQHPNAAGILLNTTTPSVSSSSFTQQLAAALQQYLGQSGSGTNLEIDISPAQSQGSGASQFLVTVKSQTPATITTSSPVPAAPKTAPRITGPSISPILDTRALAGATTPLVEAPAADSGATRTPVETTPVQTTPSDGSTPPGYQIVPFGSSSTAMPTLAAELAESNRVNAMMAQINPDSLCTALAQSGDPMYGGSIPGSSMQWNDLTENQQLAFQHAALAGLPQGQTMDQFLAANVGPSAWWNASYSQPNMFGAPPAPGSVNMHTNGYTATNG